MAAQPYVLLWSASQNAVKIQTLERCMSETRADYTANLPGDFRTLLVGTKADVEAAAANIRPTLVARGGTFPAVNAREAA